MADKLITELSINELIKKGENQIGVDDDTIITPAAKDRARQFNIRFITMKESSIKNNTANYADNKIPEVDREIIIGCDHGGYQLKVTLIKYIQEIGYKVIDVGTNSEESCDYPDFAYEVARRVALGERAKGIMIDSVGIASAIVANKIKGIRAANCYDEFSARSAREHNDANLLTLGGKTIGVELAKSIVKIWLDTSFAGGRHQKRIDKIKDIEKTRNNS